jgi:hypothetical protein
MGALETWIVVSAHIVLEGFTDSAVYGVVGALEAVRFSTDTSTWRAPRRVACEASGRARRRCCLGRPDPQRKGG